MTTTRNHRRSRRSLVAGGLVLTALAAALLAGCSASDDADNAPAPDAAAGLVGGDGSLDSEPADADASDDGTASNASTTAGERQVVQTGDVRLSVTDTLKATNAVVAQVEHAGGRVDDRTEEASTSDSGGHATLVVRVPASEVTATVAALRGLGTVESVDLKATDVTGAAQDLDARIHALELSIGRMEALLARATTSKEIITAEGALTERQSTLEQLRSERARMADQISLSTLNVTIEGPEVVPPPAQADGPSSFLGGLGVGWDAFVASAKSVLIVAGVLLPWLAFAGAVVAGIVAVSRWRGRRSAGPAVPVTVTAEPVPAGPAVPAAPKVDPDA